MRIGVIAPPWLKVPPGRYGGTENVLDGLCRALHAMGHDVILVAPMGSRCPVPMISLRVSTDLSMGHALVEVPYTLAAYAALMDAGVDVIHDHTQVGFLLHKPRQPVLTTNHNLFDAGRQKIYAEAARRGVRVVAISEHHASTASAAGIPIAGVVHNGIDVASVPVGKGDGGYACVLSRMSPTKGIREAILLARRAGIPLQIAAKMQSSDEHAYFDEQIHPLLDGDVEYLGEVSARGKWELLGGACALLMPIQWDEPFGMAMIESMACGTPVLATRRGAAPEIITDGVTGCVRDSWESLPAALAEIAEAPLNREIIRYEAEERFGIERMAQGYLDLFQTQALKGH